LSFPDRFSTKATISNFIKTCPAGAEVFHSEKWADVTKLKIAFHNSANVPKK
jgi:hypothetical protein